MTIFYVGRIWDDESITEFQKQRNEQRSRKGLPPFDSLNPNDKAVALEEERCALVANQLSRLAFKACPLEKYPLQSCSAPTDGVLICPTILREKPSLSVKLPFKKGDNLFSKAYYYYSQTSTGPPPGPNYISDSIRTKRYEFLGPSPCIAGFRLKGETAEILFWDSYINTTWIHQYTWAVDVEFDETVEAWLPVAHNS